MKQKPAVQLPHPKSFVAHPLWPVVISLLLAIGIGGAGFTAIGYSAYQHTLFKRRIKTISQMLDSGGLVALTEGEKTPDSSQYSELKGRLIGISSANPDVRQAYVVFRNSHNKIVYAADSEPTSSPDHDQFGAEYAGRSDTARQLLEKGQTKIEGPYRTPNGLWITAFAPVYYDGRVVAVVGMDLDAKNFYLHTGLYASIPFLGTFIPLTLLLFIRRFLRSKEELVQTKALYGSIAAHELRTPLTAIRWASEVLLTPDNAQTLTEAKRQLFLTQIHDSAVAQLETIESLMSLTVLEKHGSPVWQNVNLWAVINLVCNNFQLTTTSKDIRLENNLPNPIWVMGSRQLLINVFSNLTANSIKYSGTGASVNITYRRDGRYHVISVADQGIGIPRDELDKVGELYKRGSNADKSKSGGFGMGLFLVKSIIYQHGGKLTIVSNEGRGTTVTVSLPAYTGGGI